MRVSKIQVPDGLHEREYALHILTYSLCWPDDKNKTNLELIMACLEAIAKGKRLGKAKAYSYLVRAIDLAKEQGIAVDRMFFLNGQYLEMRPQRSSLSTDWVKPDWEAIRRHQETPEFKAAWDEMRDKAAAIFGVPKGKKA